MPTDSGISSLFDEDLIGLTEAARDEFPYRLKAGHLVSASTLHRWVREGVKTPLGRIKLESVFIASRRITSRQACRRFKEAVNAAMTATESLEISR